MLKKYSLFLPLFCVFISLPSLAASPLETANASFLQQKNNRNFQEWLNTAEAPIASDVDVFHKVTATYGPLQVQAGKFSGASTIKPWSSWWYPLSDDYLFNARNGQDSPLQRLDQWDASRGDQTSAANYEKTNLYSPQAVQWAGLCDSWALASITMPEPTQPVVRNGVTFRVSDQKALLLKTFEGVDGLNIFGQRNDGKWDSIFADIYPDQFHRFLQVQLFERHLPFFMDTDPGIEVWNAPVFQADMTITPDANDPTLVHVETWVKTANSRINNYDMVGTDVIQLDYTYDLHGTTQSDGTFLVTSGEWTNRSRWDHPDFVTERPDPSTLVRKSFNPDVTAARVDAIIYGTSTDSSTDNTNN
jgi:hypothetical protein